MIEFKPERLDKSNEEFNERLSKAAKDLADLRRNSSRLRSGLLVVCFGVMFGAAWVFMWIWNFAVVSAIEVTSPISYWVAFWLMIFFSVFAIVSSKGGK